MPKIYDYLGLIFFFYSNDHGNPIHIHVSKGNKQMKVQLWVERGTPVVRILRYKKYDIFNATEIGEIESFVERRHEAIIKKWEQFFLHEENPKFEKIKTKLKKKKNVKNK